MKLFRKWKKEKLECIEKDQTSVELTGDLLEKIMTDTEKEIAFLCIGSDRAIVDSMGPLMGTMLTESNLPYPVYGTLQAPVHALNLKATIEGIHQEHGDHLLIVLDACIGQKEDVGTVFLKTGPVYPGKAVGKPLPPVGDFHLLAVVNYQDKNAYESYLTDTRLFTVYDMAKRTAELILEVAWAVKELQKDAH